MAGFKIFVADADALATEMNTYLMQQAVITVTSSTRPPPSHEGMLIFETDTDRYMSWIGAAWRCVGWNSPAGRMGVSVRRSAVFSLPWTGDGNLGAVSGTSIPFDQEDFDGGGFWSSGTTVTVPSGFEGLYSITGAVFWGAAVPNDCFTEVLCTTAAYGFLPFRFYHNNISSSAAVVPVIPLAANDTIQLRAIHENFANINVTARLDAYRLQR